MVGRTSTSRPGIGGLDLSPRAALRLKLSGYGLSIVSVLLLAVPAWNTAREHPALFACLIGGASLSIAGQLMRLLANAADGPKGR